MPKSGAHPDLTLPSLEKGEEPSVVKDAEVATNLMATTRNEGETVGVHPDFDLDFALLEQTVVEALETGIGEIDPPEFLKEPWPEAYAVSEPSDKPASIMVNRPEGWHLNIDLSSIQSEHQVVAAENADLDVLDLTVPLEELGQEEGTTACIADEVGFHDLYERHQHSDIDWKFELAWASGEEWSERSGGGSSETFDFDVADLEALAEEAVPPDESAIEKERRLDGVAADLVLSLGTFRSSDRRSLFHRFRAVIEEFQHPASHAALHRLLAEGCSLEEIEEAAQLRCFWRDQPWIWAEKRAALSAWNVRRSPSKRLAFGWPTAMRLIRTFGLVESESAMVEEWFDDWAGLSRAKSISPAERMAFFTYAGYLRQLTPTISLEYSEGVFEEATDSQELSELRDPRGALIWKFENKLPPREGELSLDPVRIRNHRKFEEAAFESRLGLSELKALAPAEVIRTGFRRRYHFPDQTFDGGCGARTKVSSLHCHGVAKIVDLDLTACNITLAVPHDQKRLLEMHIALISDHPPSASPHAEEEKSDRRSGKKKKKDTDK
tara:strand:+ start:6011 stop:7666 length:1656 start_codon:yes stop_codon:yes gene_type:complete